MCCFDRSSAVWNTVTANKTFYKSTHGEFRRSIVSREGNFTCRVSISMRIKCCFFQDGCGPVWSTCHQMTAWFSEKVVANRGLGAGLFCQHVGHLARGQTNRPWWGRSLCCWGLHNRHPCHHHHFLRPLGKKQWCLRTGPDLTSTK